MLENWLNTKQGQVFHYKMEKFEYALELLGKPQFTFRSFMLLEPMARIDHCLYAPSISGTWYACWKFCIPPHGECVL